MPDTSLVSIIIPCFNQEALVVGALQSCCDQTYRPLELIVVDDGSTDATPQVVQNWGESQPGIPLRLIRQANQGPAAARQAGLEQAQGAYIQYLDGDDSIEPDKIRPQVEHLQLHTELDGVYGDWKDAGSVVRRRSFPFEDLLLALVSGKWVALHAFLLRREAALRYPWDLALEALEDLDYWFHLALAGTRLTHLPSRDCAVYREFNHRVRRNRIDERWLQARSRIQARMKDELDAAGLLDQEQYREALATAYLGLAWRALQTGSQRWCDRAVSSALDLLPESQLCRIDWMVPLSPWLGLRRSLRWQARRAQVKQSAKDWFYRGLRFDSRLTFGENLNRRFGWPTQAP